jgi:CubicO group peptidase (beta-lactamase class C family)
MPENQMNRRGWLTATRDTGFCLVACLAMAPSILASQSMQSEKIYAILKAAGLRSANVPGAAILVIKDEQIVFERGYGVTDLRSLHKIDENTNFRLASVTKQFTAMAIMLLVHDGRLHYDDQLTDIFLDFPGYGRQITVRNLLNHTSGLQDYDDLMPPAESSLAGQPIQILDGGVLDLLKAQKSTKFAPGSRWKYSNSGYVLLGLIVEKVSGKPFPVFLQDRIFAPLKMDGTVAYVRADNDVSNRAFGHTFEKAHGSRPIRAPHPQPSAMEESIRHLMTWRSGAVHCTAMHY